MQIVNTNNVLLNSFLFNKIIMSNSIILNNTKDILFKEFLSIK